MQKPRILALLAALLLAVATALVATAASAEPPGQGGSSGPVTRYVALGDSYTAAPLVPQLTVAGGCFRSTNNYPHLVAQSLGLDVNGGTAFADVSCSGAQTADMASSQTVTIRPPFVPSPVTVHEPPQFSALTPDTDLVTIGVGGNDFNVFGTLVGYCPQLRPTDPTGAPCRDAMRAGGEDKLFADLAQTSDRLETVVGEVHQLAPNARVLVVGYPDIVPRQGTCPSLLPLADGDYHYADQVQKRLNQALLHAAAVTHSTYVDAYGATVGHDICAADPWINGQVTDPTRAQAFHPFEAEQQAVAQAVLAALD